MHSDRWLVILVGKNRWRKGMRCMDRDRGGCRVNGQKSGEMFPLN